MKQNWKTYLAAICCLVTGMVPRGMAQSTTEGISSDFDYPAGLHCENGPNLPPTFVTSQGAYPFVEVTGNVVFINNLTGEIDLTASNPGTWTIKRVAPTDSTFRQVTITGQETASIFYLPDSVCATLAQTIVPLNMGTNGGTYSAAPNTISIDTANGTVNVNASQPGTYAITYTTGGVCPDTTVVPLILLGPMASHVAYSQPVFCQVGATLPDTLYPLGQGIFGSNLNGLSINPLTGQVNLGQSSPGIYQVYYHVPGTCTDTAITTIEVIAPITSNLFEYVPGMYCVTDSIILPIVFGPTNITFNTQPGLSINFLTGEIDVSQAQPGTYTILATAMTVCQEVSSQTITISDTTHLTLNQVGNTLIAPGPGANYQWYLNGVAITGATDSSIVMAASGNYTVRYDRVGDPCGTIAEGVFTGSSEPNSGIVHSVTYPQPSSGMVHYRIELQRPEGIDWRVTDLLGRTLLEGHWSKSLVHEGEMDLSALAVGHYFLRLQGLGTLPLVIER